MKLTNAPNVADPASDVTVDGIATEVKVAPENALEAIVLGFPMNVTDRRAVFPAKALSPIEVTEVGMVTEAREVQP